MSMCAHTHTHIHTHEHAQTRTTPPTGTNFGNEWVRIDGTTNTRLSMKVFGYEPGSAHVDYWYWN